MQDKLEQLDAVIKQLVSAIDQSASANETLLLVIGDHGMTADGNHGGTLRDETHAAMLVFSPAAHKLNLRSHAADLGTGVDVGSVSQLNFPASLALLLGVPIPFGNIGTLIPELFTPCTSAQCAFAHGLRLNSWQVLQYLEQYSKVEHIVSPAQLESIRRDVISASESLCALESDGDRNESQNDDAVRDVLQHFIQVQCRMGSFVCRFLKNVA